tara:strand:+ start:1024 stop:1581 length:558 start_codon:yes stop_codon:yes gene_type:complete
MRVIAGSVRRMPLKVPPQLTRPTTDRLREALFSILQGRLEGSRVLDLFAGSGSLGIEALSRGAKKAAFVERSRVAAQCIRENLKKLSLEEWAIVHEQDAYEYLAASDESFDLIMADPPYASNNSRDFAAELMHTPSLLRRLADDGMLIIEVEAKREEMEAPGWQMIDRRTYGRSSILFYGREESR